MPKDRSPILSPCLGFPQLADWAYWRGQGEIVGPNNEPQEGFQSGLAAAEEGLVVALVLVVLLAWPGLKYRMRMVPVHCPDSFLDMLMKRQASYAMFQTSHKF